MAEISSDDSGKKGKKGPKKVSTKIDMTPMVDLAFLLITFFMLTTTFSKPQAMEVNMPDKNNQQTETTQYEESKTMTVVLGDDEKVYYYMGLDNPKVESTDYSAEGIRKVFSKKNSTIKEFKVIVKPMENAKYKNMVDILDEIEITGIKFFAVTQITPQDLQLVKTKTN